MTSPAAAAAYELARRNGVLDMWLVARTHREVRYKCRCVLGRLCDPRWCSCAGRVDLDSAPPRCCARVNTPAVVAAAIVAAEVKKASRRPRKPPADVTEKT